MENERPPPMTERTRLNHARGKISSTEFYPWNPCIKRGFWVPGNGYQGGSQVGWGALI